MALVNTFTLFARLAVELRLMVWDYYALPKGAVTHVFSPPDEDETSKAGLVS
ncbi:Uu.00g074780.m01.CDS01 [Anthostomella pinea]|uniref:Uu.00g074780.m01.CDS01 n=1 Tax=Anthostomella pinea TaxID=933095 RepID=A0AAI8YP19_9PEZI|nr:Uu.00g074780.m01.CDS01 [Anthostomella pinea]